MINRRTFLSATALAAGALAGADIRTALAAENTAPAQTGGAFAAGEEFNFSALVERMKEKAGNAFAPDVPALPEILANLDYDQHRAIRFNPEKSVWKDTGSNYQLQAFHPGWLYKEPVELYEIVDGNISELHFTGADFEYREPLDPEKFKDVDLPGIAGFRLHHPLNTPEYFEVIPA